MYSGCCVALPLSCLQRLLCGLTSILCTAVAVWHCPYPICSGCCVVLFMSYVQRLLCIMAPILMAALVVWFSFDVVEAVGPPICGAMSF